MAFQMFFLLALLSLAQCTVLNSTLLRGDATSPFEDVPFFIEPSYAKNIRRSLRSAPAADKDPLQALLDVPTAYWLDKKVKTVPKPGEGKIRTAYDVLSDAKMQDPKPLVTLIVYDLPNRDCAARASAGEICCKYNDDGTCDFLDKSNRCEEGLNEYKFEYIDGIAETIQEFCNDVPIALVIEPDSLPNLVTNMDNDKCSNPATVASYRTGVKYAVARLFNACEKATIYVDAAHGGWLGWEGNSEGFLKEIDGLGIAHLIRGFALNVANYQEMGILCPKVGTCLPDSEDNDHECCSVDGCGLSEQFNPGFTLLNYAASLKEIAKKVIPALDVHFLLDTGRNGVPEPRKDYCGNWCNIRGAGVGLLPTTDTEDKSMIDAYMWLKTPGESDGCTEVLPNGKKCPRFDDLCASKDSIGSRKGEPRAPEAGGWFDFQIRMLARNGRLD